MHVCYFGAFDPDYPRNQIIRAGLSSHGVRVSVANVVRRLPTWRKIAPLLAAHRRIGRYDALIVAEFNQALLPLAWALTRLRGIPLVFDCLVSLYDAGVVDRHTVKPGSSRAGVLYRLDWLAARLADAVLVDTAPNRDYLSRLLSLPPERFFVVPVGAYDTWFHPMPQADTDGRVWVQFFGSYIPFHGVEHILHAANRLRDQPDIAFELIGRGQTYTAMRALAHTLELPNVCFVEPVPPETLPARVARADLTLGVFGAGDKTRRVVPNKVYQNLAMRKPLITADSEAVRQAFTDGLHLRVVPPADPAALAAAIRALAADPATREHLAENGYRRVQEAYTPQQVGAAALSVLEQLVQ